MTQENHDATHRITFTINENECLYIDTICEFAGFLQMCDPIAWFYKGPGEKLLCIVDPYHCIESELEGFILYLQLILNGQRELDLHDLSNIGYQWNERLYDNKPNKDKWPGSLYLCFSTSLGPETFMYTIDGTIYLEIVPTYPWFFGNKPNWLKKIPFEEFLKDYKPYVRTIIPRERAEEWLSIAQNLRNIIEQNHQEKLQNCRKNETD